MRYYANTRVTWENPGAMPKEKVFTIESIIDRTHTHRIKLQQLSWGTCNIDHQYISIDGYEKQLKHPHMYNLQRDQNHWEPWAKKMKQKSRAIPEESSSR